jgi:hypothetical protein
MSYLRFQGLLVSLMSGNATALGIAAHETAAKAGELAGVDRRGGGGPLALPPAAGA